MLEKSQNRKVSESRPRPRARVDDERITTMTRFSLLEDDDEPLLFRLDHLPKRQRTASAAIGTSQQSHLRHPPPSRSPQQQQQQNPPPTNNNNDDEEEEEELISIEEVESDSQEEQEEEEEDEEEDEEEEEEEEDATPTPAVPVANNLNSPTSTCAVFTDPDVLDCPICLEILSIPVFQCENGHIACSSCCAKVQRKCPSCTMPIGYNRCRAIEKVIESVKLSCRHMNNGCKEMLTCSKKHDHEQTCLHAPCSCPYPYCNFLGSSKNLYLHFSSNHLAVRFTFDVTLPLSIDKVQKFTFLLEVNEGVVFILNHRSDGRGIVIYVNCIAPNTSKRGFPYQIVAKSSEAVLTLQSFTENVTKWSEHVSKKACLMVPTNFVSGSGRLMLHLCIKKAGQHPTDIV